MDLIRTHREFILRHCEIFNTNKIKFVYLIGFCIYSFFFFRFGHILMQLCLNCEQTFEYPFHGSVKVDIFCTIPVMNMQNWMQQNFRLKKKKNQRIQINAKTTTKITEWPPSDLLQFIGKIVKMVFVLHLLGMKD